MPQQPSEPPPGEVAVSLRRRKSQGSMRSFKSGRSRGSRWSAPTEDDGIPQHKRDFINFHSENGSRVVVGTFGPVTRGGWTIVVYICGTKGLTIDVVCPVEMLLKKGYRHVYISRHFAREHNLVPPDLMPGLHGYGGLVKCVGAASLSSNF